MQVGMQEKTQCGKQEVKHPEMEGHTAAFYVLTDPGLGGLEVLKLKKQHPKPQTKHGSFGLKEQP